MKSDERHGDGDGKNRQDGAEHGEFTPGEEGQLDEKAEKDRIKHVARKNVRPEAQRERKESRGGADQRHGKQEESERIIRGVFGRAGKRQQIVADTVMHYALPIEINEGERGAGQRDVYERRGRRESREYTKKISQQNEDGDRPGERDIFFAAVAHVFFQNILDTHTYPLGYKNIRSLLRAP